MNIQRDTEYRFGELVQSPEYSNEQGQITTKQSKKVLRTLAMGQNDLHDGQSSGGK